MKQPSRKRPTTATDSGGTITNPVELTQDTLVSLWNLHDVFLNVSVVRKAMEQAPLDRDLQTCQASDRFRLERVWHALMAVLIECWNAERTRPAVMYAESVCDTSALVAVLRRARRDGSTDLLLECRHYMFHRDQRDYWDLGRQAPMACLSMADDAYREFSRVLFVATRAAAAEAQRRGLHFPYPSDEQLPSRDPTQVGPEGDTPAKGLPPIPPAV